MKQLKKVLGYLTSPFTLGLVVTIAITYAALDYYANRHAIYGKTDQSLASLIQEIHEKTIDWRLTDRGQSAGSDRVAILAVDDESIELEGRWPWSREKMSKLVERTLAYGTKAIAFDIIFSEEDQSSALPALARLKRAAKDNQKIAGDLAPLLETEAQRADSDRIFAATIKKTASQLILGSYFYGGELADVSPHVEFCLDALFDRTYESRYWKRERVPLTVIDEPLARIKFPRQQLKTHLSDYFMALEVNAAATWFETRQDLSARIKTALDDLGAGLEPETYPGIAVLVLNNDFDNAKALLEQVNPVFADVENVRLAFTRFTSAFEKKELASIQSSIREEGLSYCSRFLSGKDELLHSTEYARRWGENPETKEQFNSLSWGAFWASQTGSNPDAGKETLEAAVERLKADTPRNRLPQILRWQVNIPLLSESTMHTGYFNAIQDTDGSIRRSRLISRHGNSYAPSLAFKTFLVDHGYNAVATLDMDEIGGPQASKELRSLDINDTDGNTVMQIPVDPVGQLMINYAGPRYMFPHISATQLLNDDPKMKVTWRHKDAKTGRWIEDQSHVVDKREFLKDKLLIAGATAMAVYDLRVTPFDENFPGVETHANVLSNLLVEHTRLKGSPKEKAAAMHAPGFLRTHPAEERSMWAVLLAIGILLSGLLTWFGSISGLGITAAALGGVYAVDRYYFFASGYVTTVLFPVLLIVTNFVTLTFYKYFTEERKKRELKGTFEKYVSPAIVNEILSDPENIELGGKKMELTVMFSDVRGFTTISEKLDPRALSDLLNSYLTPMTNLVFQHKGTLDKYMGDAIMAFWGAPLHFQDHAKHACRCALHMLEKLRELQQSYRDKGLPEIDIGIGLNTGEMSVGNMGSDTVRSYTVMGDAVNLGSRLEGINKEYGTRIIISEFTFAAVQDAFVCREVDWVRVKGKVLPVRIYELVAEGSVDASTQSLLENFNSGFSLYHERKFEAALEAFHRALEAKSDDAVTQLYIKRCKNYLEEPPAENWDGVFTMKTK